MKNNKEQTSPKDMSPINEIVASITIGSNSDDVSKLVFP